MSARRLESTNGLAQDSTVARFYARPSSSLHWASIRSCGRACVRFAVAVSLGATIASAVEPRLVNRAPHTSAVETVAWSPDGARFLTAGADNTARLWDAETGALIRIFRPPGESVRSITPSLQVARFDPTGDQIALGGDRGCSLWNGRNGELLGELDDAKHLIDDVAYRPDGALIATVGSGEFGQPAASLWDVSTRRRLAGFLRGSEVQADAIAFSPDGQYVAVATQALRERGDSEDWDAMVDLWDVTFPDLPKHVRTYRGHPDAVDYLAFSPDGRRIFAGCLRQLRIWDFESDALLGVLQGDRANFLSVAVDERQGLIVAGCDDHTVRLYSLESGKLLETIPFDCPVLGVAFQDGRVAIAGEENVVRVWNRTAAEFVSAATGPTPRTGSIAFTTAPSGWLTGGHPEAEPAWIRSTPDGARRVAASKPHAYAIVATTSDGSMVASGGNDGRVCLWDGPTGDLIRTLEYPFPLEPDDDREPLTALALHAPTQSVVAGYQNGAAAVWSRNDAQPQIVAPIRGNEITALMISGDGARLFIGSMGRIDCRTLPDCGLAWSKETDGHFVTSLVSLADGTRIVSAGREHPPTVWMVSDGEKSLACESAHRFGLATAALDPTGRSIAAGINGDAEDGRVSVWNLSGELRAGVRPSVTDVRVSTDSEMPNAIAIRPEDGRLLLGWDDGGTTTYDRRTSTLADATAPGPPTPILAVASDGMTFLTASGTAIYLWDRRTGYPRRQLVGHTTAVTAVVLSDDGKLALTGDKAGAVRVWRLEDGTLENCFNGPAMDVACVAIDTAGKRGMAGFGEQALQWNLATNEALPLVIPSDAVGIMRAVDYSADGNLALTAHEDGFVRVYDAATGELKHSVPGPEFAYAWDASFNRTGDQVLVAYANYGRTAQIRDIATAKVVREFGPHDGFLERAVFGSKEETVLTSSWDETAKLWDAKSGRLLRSFPHMGSVRTVGFLDASTILTAATDGSIRLWQHNKEQPLAQLSVSADKWSVIARRGQFDTATIEDLAAQNWFFDDDPYSPVSPEIFALDFYEPQLFSLLLDSERRRELERRPIPSLASVNRVQPRVGDAQGRITCDPIPERLGWFRVTVPIAGMSGDVVRAVDKDVDRTSVHDLRIFRDGQIVARFPRTAAAAAVPSLASSEEERNRWRRDTEVCGPGKEVSFTAEFRVPLHNPGGSVEVSAYAFNRDRVRSAIARTTVSVPKTSEPIRRAYLIAFGANAFEESSWNLQYADDDAREFRRAFRESLTLSNQFDEVVDVELVSDWTQAEGVRSAAMTAATKSNLQATLALLAGGCWNDIPPTIRRSLPDAAEDLRQATPDDLVLLFVSSHGYTDAAGVFYLLPYDIGRNAPSKSKVAADPLGEALATLVGRCVSSEDLTNWMEPIDAGNVALVIDACEAGGAVAPPGFKHGPFGSRGLGQLAYDKGMQVLAASTFDEATHEPDQLGHGLLTHALVDVGLRLDGDSRRAEITLNELFRDTAERLPDLRAAYARGELKTKSDKPVKPRFSDIERSRLSTLSRPIVFDFGRGRETIRLTRLPSAVAKPPAP